MLGRITSSVQTALFETTIRLGVTGLSRAGKTVFITSLVANLMAGRRLPQFLAAGQGRIEAAYLQPQPDDTVPRFEYEKHLGQLTRDTPGWPDSTRAISALRLTLRVRTDGMFGGARIIHLDIVDYPGEWLLDLALLDKSYDDWAAAALLKAADRDGAAAFRASVADLDEMSDFAEETAQSLAKQFTDYLCAAKAAGAADCGPGRFLLPGEMAGSPALTFAPLPAAQSGKLRAEMARRYEAYKKRVVRPFFTQHFARIDRQIVLIDLLDALARGPAAVAELDHVMGELLSAFRPGTNSFLGRLFGQRRVDRILFAATKADHLHHSQHPQLTGLITAMNQVAANRAGIAGAGTAAMSLSALRATAEADLDGLPAVQGIGQADRRPVGYFGGEIPDDPSRILSQAAEGRATWDGFDFAPQGFAPQRLADPGQQGAPHIRLDKALEYLIGDRI